MSSSGRHTAEHSSESVEHYTPPEYVEAARATMGGIDLDPASNRRANDKLVKATRYFNAADNGFEKPWSGRVFLNPPGGICGPDGRGVRLVPRSARAKGDPTYRYTLDGSPYEGPRPRSSICAWWDLLVAKFDSNEIDQAVFVAFTTEALSRTQGGHSILSNADALCFPAKRLQFFAPFGVSDFMRGKSPPHASFIAYLGDCPEDFAKHFEPFGEVGRFALIGTE